MNGHTDPNSDKTLQLAIDYCISLDFSIKYTFMYSGYSFVDKPHYPQQEKCTIQILSFYSGHFLFLSK